MAIIRIVGAFFSLLTIVSCGGGTPELVLPTTYDISGEFFTNSAEGFTTNSFDRYSKNLKQDLPLPPSPCIDGFFYSVTCTTLGENPESFRSSVFNCSGESGGYGLSGLPRQQPIICSISRSSPDSLNEERIGNVLIPAPTLSGETETLTPGGNFNMDIRLQGSGRILGTIPEEQRANFRSTLEPSFFSESINGIYDISCASAFSEFFPKQEGQCSCLLNTIDVSAQYPPVNGSSSLRLCLEDNGRLLSSSNRLVELNIYSGQFTAEIPNGSQPIAIDTSFNAVSLWQAPSGVSARATGGEGASDLGGLINWNTGGQNPTTPVNWSSSETVTVGSASISTPDLSSIGNDFNQFSHDQWMQWIGSLVEAAETAGFNCTQGPLGSEGVISNDYSENAVVTNIPCANEILEAMANSRRNIPKVQIQPFCDSNGCRLTSNPIESNAPYYSPSIINLARLSFPSHRLDYPQVWQSTDNYSLTGTTINPVIGFGGGIGVSPGQRLAFSHMNTFANGASFQRTAESRLRFQCIDTTASEPHQIENQACALSSIFYGLTCTVVDQLSVRLIGNASPFESLFEVSTSVVAAELAGLDSNTTTPSPVAPIGTTAIELCRSKISGHGGALFPVRWTKN